MLVNEKKLKTYCVFADAVALAANKHHISILNPVGSNYVVRLRKLFLTNQQLSAVTGVACRFDLRGISALASGTDLSVKAHDSIDALPAGLVAQSGGTVTDVFLNCSLSFNNDEVGATANAYDYQHQNWLPEGEALQAPTLRAGEGFTVKQITNSTVGSFGWLLVFTVEDLV